MKSSKRWEKIEELFQSAVGGGNAAGDPGAGFTVEMRRELLEMEREAGREDRMIEAYHQLVAAEPDELTWRSGLAQALLERGDQAEAEALWGVYVQGFRSGVRLLLNSACPRIASEDPGRHSKSGPATAFRRATAVRRRRRAAPAR